MKTPHTSAPRGKRVRIVLRDGGRVIIAKFVERTSRFVVLEHGSVAARSIRSLSILKDPHS